MYREGLAIYPMPLYPYLISLVHKLIPNWVLAGRLISYFSMTLTVVPLYLLSKDLFDRRASFWGCIAFTLLPETLLQSNSVMRDPSFFLFAMWAVYFAQKALQTKRLIHLSGSALFAWFSTLFRIEGLIIFPAYFCFLIVLAISKGDQRKDYIRMMAAWGGLFVCLIAAIYISMESRGEIINRYNDWTAFFFFASKSKISGKLPARFCATSADTRRICEQHCRATFRRYRQAAYGSYLPPWHVVNVLQGHLDREYYPVAVGIVPGSIH